MQETIRQCWQHRAVFALLSLDGRSAATSFCGFSRWQPQRARHKQNDTNQILQVLNTESFQENSKHQIASFNRHKKDECSTIYMQRKCSGSHRKTSCSCAPLQGFREQCGSSCHLSPTVRNTQKPASNIENPALETKHCIKHHSSY